MPPRGAGVWWRKSRRALTREVGLRLSLLFVFLLVAPAWADDVQVIAPGLADELLGHTVRVIPDGKPPENIGRVIDVLVDTDGHPVAAVLDLDVEIRLVKHDTKQEVSKLSYLPAHAAFGATTGCVR